MHEEPEVPNYVSPRARARLVAGMTLAIEPMVNVGGYEVRRLKDGWTVVTADGKLSAHYENTILITNGDPEIPHSDPKESMMRSDIVTSDVVASLCGRDKGALMMVVGLDSEGYAFLCDGLTAKNREAQTGKKLRHIRLVCHTDCQGLPKSSGRASDCQTAKSDERCRTCKSRSRLNDRGGILIWQREILFRSKVPL